MKTRQIMCISKILTDLCFTKQIIKTKNTFAKVVYSVLTEHKKVCLSINGAKSVRLEKGAIEFKNYFKQTWNPFNNYAYFECNLKYVKSFEGSYSKKYQDHVPCTFSYKIVCVCDKFTKSIVVFRG